MTLHHKSGYKHDVTHTGESGHKYSERRYAGCWEKPVQNVLLKYQILCTWTIHTWWCIVSQCNITILHSHLLWSVAIPCCEFALLWHRWSIGMHWMWLTYKWICKSSNNQENTTGYSLCYDDGQTYERILVITGWSQHHAIFCLSAITCERLT